MNRLLLTWLCLISLPVGLRAADVSFDYEQSRPLDVQVTGSREKDGGLLRDISYASLVSGRNAATVVAPKEGTDSKPGVLFVHWYGPPQPTSNRTQFIPDAIELAKGGAISLLIDTPWSRPEYFQERARDGDYRARSSK